MNSLTIAWMRHAILGAGGIGGLVGGALARAGADVVLVLRPETLARHPARLRIASAALSTRSHGQSCEAVGDTG